MLFVIVWFLFYLTVYVIVSLLCFDSLVVGVGMFVVALFDCVFGF